MKPMILWFIKIVVLSVVITFAWAVNRHNVLSWQRQLATPKRRPPPNAISMIFLAQNLQSVGGRHIGLFLCQGRAARRKIAMKDYNDDFKQGLEEDIKVMFLSSATSPPPAKITTTTTRTTTPSQDYYGMRDIGIALSFLRRLITALRGNIRVDEQYDSDIAGHPGTRFIIQLKSALDPVEEIGLTTQATTTATTTTALVEKLNDHKSGKDQVWKPKNFAFMAVAKFAAKKRLGFAMPARHLGLMDRNGGTATQNPVGRAL